MFNLSAKGAMICAVLPIGLLVSACSSTNIAYRSTGGHEVGLAPVNEIIAGNWAAAKEDINYDYANYSDHPAAVFNMGVSYRHDGDIDKAATMFSETAQTGDGIRPDFTLEPRSAGVTIKDQSCARLHRDNRLDANCGDQIALAAAAAPPAPIAEATPEPAPAVEAEATTVSPKQDRN